MSVPDGRTLALVIAAGSKGAGLSVGTLRLDTRVVGEPR